MSSDRTVSRRAILKGAAIGGGALLLDRVGLASTLQTSTPSTDVVLAGEDLTPSPNHVRLWNAVTQQYQVMTTTWDRLCSADLPDEKALRHGNRGTSE